MAEQTNLSEDVKETIRSLLEKWETSSFQVRAEIVIAIRDITVAALRGGTTMIFNEVSPENNEEEGD